MKIVLISFGRVNGILLDIYKEMIKHNRFPVYWVSTYVKSDEVNYISYSKILWFLYRVFSKVIKILNFPYYVVRHFQELFYEFVFFKRLREPIIIITTNGWIPKIFEKNKRLGGLNILLAGNPCDLEMSKILIQERQKIGKIKDIYNFEPRLSRYKRVINNSDFIITFNDLINNSFLNYVNPNKLKLFKGIFLIDELLYSSKKTTKNNLFTFSYIGHTITLKGLHILLDAWEISKIENAILIIGGTIQDELKQTILNKINEFDNIIYKGKIEDINEFYRQSHVFICPSIIDAGPMTIVEAMYCGLPVIASNGAGNSYLIENYITGITYKYNDINELSNALLWFVKNQNMVNDMGKNAEIRINQEIINSNKFYTKTRILIESLS